MQIALDYLIRWDYIHTCGYRIRLEVLQTATNQGWCDRLLSNSSPTLERNKMTETVTVIKKQPTCAELVDEQWKDRQEDLKDPEYEALAFDYVEPHTFNDQPEGYWRWQFSWGGPSDELRGYVNEHGELHRLEYWYLDWGDGAHVQVDQDAEAWTQMQEMIG